MIAACSASARQLAPSVQQGRVVPQRAQPALHGWLRFPAAWLSPAAARFARSLAAVAWLSSVAAACGCRSLWALRLLARPARPVPARVARCAHAAAAQIEEAPATLSRRRGFPRQSLARKNSIPPSAGLVKPPPRAPNFGGGRERISSVQPSTRRNQQKPCAVLLCLGARGGPPLRRPFPPCAPLSPPYPPSHLKGCLLPMRGARALIKGGSSARQCPPLSGGSFMVRRALPLAAGAGWSRSALLRLLPIRARALGVQRPIAARCASWLGARCTAAQRLRERSACALLGALRARLIRWLCLFVRLRQLIRECVRHRSAFVPMV